ncbi:MAG: mobilization protein [Gammaproteobacteria bacterium]|nr:mobilization protein [Gammaproteobacteria bacterium]
MSNIHFIGGEKGGVGKSVMARVLAQYFIDREIPIVGFDSDRSHASFSRFYSDFASPVIVDQFESLDAIMEVFEESEDSTVIVDLAAQAHRPLSSWILESDLIGAVKDIDIGIKFWHVMDDGKESIQLLKTLCDTYGAEFQYIIVLNEGRGADFSAFEDSEEKERALRLGAAIMRLPKLQPSTMQKIDRLNSSFWAAVNNGDRDNKVLGMLERRRAKAWLHKAFEAIDGVLTPAPKSNFES